MDHNGNVRTLTRLSVPQRNNYFYGKLLDVPHLQMESDYINRKRWLLNRLGLGKGVLCGLEMELSSDGKQLCIKPGIAIDGYGREISVPDPYCFDPWKLADDCGRANGELPRNENHDITISICYRECFADYAPALVTDCNVQEQCAPGTIRESFFIRTSKDTPPGIESNAGLCDALSAPGRDSAETRKNLCVATQGDCPGVPDDSCVVLGVVSLRGEDEETESTITNIDTCTLRRVVYSNAALLDMILCLAGNGGGPESGVRSADAETGMPVSATYDPPTGNIHFVIPPGAPGNDGVSVRSADAEAGTPVSAAFDRATGNIHFVIPPGPKGDPGAGLNPNLTKIEVTSWEHEGVLTIDQFMRSGLSVEFSKDVFPAPTSPPNHPLATRPLGWFLVTVEYPIVHSPPRQFPHLQQSTIFVQRVFGEVGLPGKKIDFTPDPNFRNTFDQIAALTLQSEQPILCRVVLKCGYLTDGTDAVDGDFLNRMLPTGDGIPGGDFESWFVLDPLPSNSSSNRVPKSRTPRPAKT